jgi:hypothetical protein
LEQLQLQSAAIPNQVNLPLSSAAVDANRLGDKKNGIRSFQVDPVLNRSKPSDQSDTRPLSQVNCFCIRRNAHHIY